MKDFMTIGELANRLGCQSPLIRKLIRRGDLPEPPRVGCMRVYSERDVSKVRKALVAAGYLAGHE